MLASAHSRFLGAVLAALSTGAACAGNAYGPGVSDTEIKIGQTMPYSGPLSAYGTIGKAEAAYFEKINAEGGINGRKIKLITLDDGFNPAKTVEQTRKLIEDEQVLLLFSSLGTLTNNAIRKDVNAKKVPQLFVLSGAMQWTDVRGYPWSMGWPPAYQMEAKAYARYVLQTRPNARIAVLYQNDDHGKEYLKGFKDGLGTQAARLIVSEASYAPSDPTVDSQVVTLQASSADVFMNFATAKAAAQAIRKAHEIGWKPLQLLTYTSSSVEAVLKPAGVERATGIVSASFLKDPGDAQWNSDAAMQEWRLWMKRYYPDGNTGDVMNAIGYSMAQTLVQVLKQCADDLTRENVMRQAANLRGLELPMLLPGVRVDTASDDYAPIEQVQLVRFDGTKWVRFGDLYSGRTPELSNQSSAANR
jgi:branched-chain amino acid transport system substrate-binding protein